MSTLKQVLHYEDTNSIEATWVDKNDVVIRCHSYADCQMNMFKENIATYGGDVAEYAELIATVEANIVPYVAPALTEQDFTVEIQTHLDSTAQKTKWDNMQSARACAGIPLDGTESDVEVAMHTDAVNLSRWYLKVWAYCYAQLDAIKAGTRETPSSTEAFIAELPVLGA